MPISVTCTNCEKTLKAPDVAEGKWINCPSCGESVEVVIDDEYDVAPEDDEDAPAPGEFRKSGGGMPPRPGRGARSARSKGLRPADMSEARKGTRRRDRRRDSDAPGRPGRVGAGKGMSAADRRSAAREARQYRKEQKGKTRSARPSGRESAGPVDVPGRGDLRPTHHGPSAPSPVAPARGVAGNCPQCNTHMTPGAVLCVNCGLNVATGERMGGMWEQPRSINWSAIIGPVVALALMYAAYWGVNEYIIKPQREAAAEADEDEPKKKRPKRKTIKQIAKERDKAFGRKPKSRPKTSAARRTPKPRVEQAPKTFGSNREGYACTVPEGWRPSGGKILLGPASLRNAKIVFGWARGKTMDSEYKTKKNRLGSLGLPLYVAGPLEPYPVQAYEATTFLVTYNQGHAKIKRRIVYVNVKGRVLSMELSGQAADWDGIDKDFRAVLDSLKLFR